MANFVRFLIACAASLSMSMAGAAEPITVASTTSTEQSGLFGHVLPRFTAATGIQVKVVALGTGQALDLGRRGDADVVLVHDRPAEDRFVTEGYGIERRGVMYNDFVLIGPAGDHARVAEAKTAAEALRRIAEAGATFVSRGDRSGTHAAELRQWQVAGVDPKSNKGYLDAGAGMGPTLNMAAALDGYTLADRGTWLSFRNRQQLRLLLAGDPQLFNPYGVILVNPARHPHVKQAEARRFMAWLAGKEGQEAIASYGIEGQPLFFPQSTAPQ
ncbi:MAG TPA: substrate-binding domain-containing protein [Burkholderiaceae bacterium]|nr:substrate-binding domain-containing protein [Burkholderiaceae bacterium]